MQDDLALMKSDPSKTKSVSPKKYTVLSQKSPSTYDSDQTGGSKRSTEEEELRSLSTTPRYSHEDLGRVVSPPHSSDLSIETEQEVDEILSAKEVFLKSRTSQLTHLNILPVRPSDKDSLYLQQTLKTQSNVFSEKAWAKSVQQHYNKYFANSEKANARTDQKPHKEGFSSSDKLPLKSHVTSTATAPDLQSLKARKENQNKPNYSDHDFKKSYKPLGGTEYNRPHDSRRTSNSQLRPSVGANYHQLRPSAGDNYSQPRPSVGANYSQLRPSAGAKYNQLRPLADANYRQLRAEELMEMRMSSVDSDLKNIKMDAENTNRELMNELDRRKLLENQLQEIDEERKELNTKLATLRVKLGVANSNYNVSKNECDQMRKMYQETQIKKARLEERIQTCTKELEKLKDPNNPDSNVNMKKIVLNDRKEIRRLRTELEGVRSERSEVHKQIQDKDERIKMLHIYIGEAKDQLDECNRDYEVAKISVTAERLKREEVEVKYNELMKGKDEFDEEMAEIQAQLDVAVTGSTGVMKQSEQYREKEEELVGKIDVIEKKLRDTLTAIEQEKNRTMPFRTATSIKHHQYRMTTSGWVTDTTPNVIVTSNANGSIGSSGFLGKTVVSTKPVKSLPAGKATSRTTPRSKGSSLPDRK